VVKNKVADHLRCDDV